MARAHIPVKITSSTMSKLSLRGASALALLIAVPAAFPNIAFAQYNGDEPDEIIVTGSPLGTAANEALSGLSVLTGDELSDRLAGTIGETLKNEPGLSSSFFGAGASRPIIRGLDGDRVRILNNGIGSIDASSASPDHAVATQPAVAERIEVVRGAAILRYGSSGAGGVVNVIDGRIPSEHPENDFSASLHGAYTTVDRGYTIAGSTDFSVTDNIVAHFDYSRLDAGDFDIPVPFESAILAASEGEEFDEDAGGERLENSFVENDTITGGLSWVDDWGFLGVAVHSLDKTYGIPGGHEEGEEEEGEEGEEGEEEEEENVFIVQDQFRVDVNGELNLSSGFIDRVQLFAGYADYEHIEFEAVGEPGTVFANEGGEIRLEAIQSELIEGHSGAYGFQYRTRDFSAIGEEAFVPPSTTDQFAVYTFQKKDFERGHIEGALRYENTDQENSVTEQNETFNLISISGGVDFHLTENFRIGGTAFRTERAPTTEELFSNGPHLATGQFEIGNPDLDKETALGVEAAIRFETEHQMFSANVFYTSYDDFIFLANTDEEEDGLVVALFQAEDTDFRGFELQGRTDLPSFNGVNFHADALLEFVRADTDTQNLPRIPPFSILAGLDADWQSFNLRGEIDYVAAADENLGEFELPTENFIQTNFFLNYDVTVAEKDVRLSLGIKNAFDVEARQHASFLKDIVPLPGRNFRLAINAGF